MLGIGQNFAPRIRPPMTGAGIVRRDDGGAIDPNQAGGVGGIMPSLQSVSPQGQRMQAQYSGMPTEKLQELSGMMGGTPQGQVIRGILTRRLTQPNAQGAQPQQQAAQPQQAVPQPQQQPQGAAQGGIIKRDLGGGMSLSQADPYWARSEQAAESHASGYLSGDTFGRADSLKATAPGGAHVIPADVISSLGEGNSEAGARVMDQIMQSGPYGTPMPRHGGHGSSMPRAPAAPPDGGTSTSTYRPNIAKGGGVQGGTGTTPVMLSHGEYVIHPDHIVHKFGDLKTGHKALDQFVEEERARHIATLKKLPGPVKS